MSSRAAETSVRSIALGQIDAALAAARDLRLAPAQAAFAVRKRCKKLRALVRLIRPGFAGYAVENEAYRAIARPLAVLRDGEALVTAYDRLLDASGAARGPTAAVRRRLVSQRAAIAALIDPAQLIGEAAQELSVARERVPGWRLEGDLVARGFARTRRRAARAMAAAREDRDPERLHEWRRHAKYHWHHCRLLRGLAPEMAERMAVADRVAKLLGEHHDLALLIGIARGIAGGEALVLLAEARQKVIEPEALTLGGELFSAP